MNNNERLKKLDSLRKGFVKEYSNSIIKHNLKIPRATSTSLSVNYVFGGGAPYGRILEIYGEFSHGKSLFACILMKDVQKDGKAVCVLDYEHAIDYSFLEKQGVDTSEDKFMCLSPETLEDGFSIIEELAKSEQFGLVIFDSTNSAPTKSESESDYGASNMGSQAKIFSQSFKKAVSLISKKKLCVTFISQIREKVGVIFGSPLVVGVGKSLAFYSSIRIKVKRESFIEDENKKVVGINFNIDTNLKNKTFPPKRQALISCYYNEGHDKYLEYADFGIKYGVIDKAGSWYSYNNSKLGQGKDRVIAFLKENEDISNDIFLKICERMNKAENIDFPFLSSKLSDVTEEPKKDEEKERKIKEVN